MGHRADVESEGSYQSLYSQNSSSLSCPVAALRRPGPRGQQRPQRETNTQHLSLLLPPSLSIPLLLPAHTLSVPLRPTVCLPSPPSISVTPLCSDLSQTQRGSLVYSRSEREGGGGLLCLFLSSCLFVRPFRIVWRSERKSKESWLLRCQSYTLFYRHRTAIVIITTLALCPFPSALPEHKQSCRNFQTGTQFAHYGIALFRSVHSLKTTSSNDGETLWLEGSIEQAF